MILSSPSPMFTSVALSELAAIAIKYTDNKAMWTRGLFDSQRVRLMVIDPSCHWSLTFRS